MLDICPEMERVIIVDFENLSWTRENLGIGKYNLRKLKAVLEKIGTLPVRCGPFVALAPTAFSYIKALNNTGYVISRCEERGQDDKCIIDMINNLSNDVGEIVLVSGDQDFLPAISGKIEKGVKVFWVSTKKTNSKGHPQISDVITRDQRITFIDLAEYKDEIMLEPWIERSASAKNSLASMPCEIVVTVSMDCSDILDGNGLLTAIQGLKDQFSNIAVDFQITGTVVNSNSGGQ